MSGTDDRLLWREIEARLVRRCGIFDLYESRRRAAGGREGVFHLLQAPDWVNVVPVLRDESGKACFLMVKQYRQGICDITVEFPAGLVEDGEPPEAAAARELFEETGYRAGSLKAIGLINPNPAFMSNRSHTFLAEGLFPDAEWGPDKADELELLDVLRVPVEELLAGIGRGPYYNSMTALALYWFERETAASMGE
jgi:ADP-ribose pyrophosphatase